LVCASLDLRISIWKVRVEKDNIIMEQDEISKEYKKYAVIYGHNSPIVSMKADDLLGIVVSIEQTGICFVHTLEGRFFRKFNLG
jgi:hypothetical protein